MVSQSWDTALGGKAPGIIFPHFLLPLGFSNELMFPVRVYKADRLIESVRVESWTLQVYSQIILGSLASSMPIHCSPM